MAQTPQAEETGGGAETPPPAGGQSQGLLGNSTLILVLVFGVAFFLWNRRRQSAMQERLLAQRRERAETAERSAMDVAHIMRQPASREAAAAAAAQGLASAARMPTVARAESGTDIPATGDDTVDEDRARVIERAEAMGEAERAAEEQAVRAARAAELAGESEERRMAAAEAVAAESGADTADAMGARAAMRHLDLDTARDVPPGAVAGDGTATCPPGFPIKGNAQSMIFHEPGQVSYPPTVAEFCFASAEAAKAAGFRQSRAREQRSQK